MKKLCSSAWLASALICFSGVAQSTTWDTKRVSEYHNESDVVARVRITAGAMVRGKEGSNSEARFCAGRYDADIVDLLKGPSAGTISFYSTSSLTVATEYLVFLSKDVRENAMVSTNSVSMAAKNEFDEGCKGSVPDNVLHSNEFALSEFYTAFGPAETPSDWVTPAWVTFPIGDFPERHDIKLTVEEVDGLPASPPPKTGFHPMYQRFPIPFSVWKFDGGVKWDEYRAHIISSARGDDKLVYPTFLSQPNLFDRDSKTYKPIPKASPLGQLDD